MHVVLVCDAYPPEVRSASLLTYDFASGLRDRGHRVTVVTSYPRYNLPTDAPKGGYPTDAIEEGVHVIRIPTLPIKKVSLVRRGIGELFLPYQFGARSIQLVREPVDIIEVYLPPLPLSLAGWAMKKHFGCPLVVNVQDLFPQNAVDLGLVRNPIVLAGLLTLERMAYGVADAMTVHSPGNRDFLIAHRAQRADKIAVVPNWVMASAFEVAQPSGNGFRRRFGLDGKFVMLFAGVLGPAQGLDVLVDAAWELRNEPNMTLLMVGDGTEKKRLMERCFARGQANVRFENFVTKDEYPGLVAESDVGLVSITPRYRTPVVPAKLLGYMAGGIPAIASLNTESDGHNILRASGAGISVASGDIAGVAAAMRRLRDDPQERTRMGARGRAYAREHFDRDRCVRQYEQIFESLRHQDR